MARDIASAAFDTLPRSALGTALAVTDKSSRFKAVKCFIIIIVAGVGITEVCVDCSCFSMRLIQIMCLFC